MPNCAATYAADTAEISGLAAPIQTETALILGETLLKFGTLVKNCITCNGKAMSAEVSIGNGKARGSRRIPLRAAVLGEVHARPFTPLETPRRILHLLPPIPPAMPRGGIEPRSPDCARAVISSR